MIKQDKNPSNSTPLDDELREQLLSLYSANFNDGEPIESRVASRDMFSVSTIVDFIDDFVVPLITAEADRRVYRFADSIYGDVTGAYLLDKNPYTSALLKDTETILNAELRSQQEEIK